MLERMKIVLMLKTMVVMRLANMKIMSTTMFRASREKVKDYDDVDDVYDDVHIDDDGSGLDKVSGELSGRSRSVEVLTRQGMSSLKGL